MRKLICVIGTESLSQEMIEDLVLQIRGRIGGMELQMVTSPEQNCRNTAQDFIRHFPKLKPIILDCLDQSGQTWQADPRYAFERIEDELATLDRTDGAMIMVASPLTIHAYASFKTDEKIPPLLPGRVIVLNFHPGIEPAFEYFSPSLPQQPTS